MGLEKLKSAFSDIIHTSEVQGRHSESPTTNTPFIPTSILEATSYAYNSILDEPMDIPQFDAPLLSDLYNNPDTTTGLNDPSSDIRFQVGLGFPSPNTKIVMAREGVEANIAYFQTATGDMMLVASGAITKLGSASEKLAKIGIDTPNFDFGVSVTNPFSEGTLLGSLSKPDPVPLHLTYPMMLEEMFNRQDAFSADSNTRLGTAGGNLNDDFVDNATGDETRGIAFQVLGTQNKTGLIPDFKLQDAIQNEKTVEYINPVTGFTPGNIKFKDNYFKDIGQSLGGLASALTGGSGGDASREGDEGEVEGENDWIRRRFEGMGGIFGSIGGFGKRLEVPEFLKLDIDFSSIGNFGNIFGGGGGGFLGGIGNSFKSFGSNIGSKFNSKMGGVRDSLKEIGGPIADSLKDVASNLNPLEEFELPQIELQNPRTVSVTEYGGQAIFAKNTPRALTRNIPLRATAPVETADRAFKKNSVSTPYSKIGTRAVRYAGIGELGKLRSVSSYYPNSAMDEKAGGDKMTLMDIKSPTLSEYDKDGINQVDSEKYGMPFFFKDLRNETFIIFRGYLAGISETVSPSWSEQSYIGRSEKNWVYTGSDRSISFTFKLVSQTAQELDSIYFKLNKLTGLAYPEYKADQFIQTNSQQAVIPQFKTRMKPPLARMRLGDLYGNPRGMTQEGVLGFLKSLSYTFPDESPWETRHGQRVPKFIDVQAEWQVIHEQVPDMNYPEFYGYNPDRSKFRSSAEIKRLDDLSDNTAEESAIV